MITPEIAEAYRRALLHRLDNDPDFPVAADVLDALLQEVLVQWQEDLLEATARHQELLT